MRTIFVDKTHRCFCAPAAGRVPVETAYFDGQCEEVVEGYRYLAKGVQWTREDGVRFEGETAIPLCDITALLRRQNQRQSEALRLLGEAGEEDPCEEARRIRAAVAKAVQTAEEPVAAALLEFTDVWLAGRDYETGQYARYEDALYRCLSGHTAQDAWAPGYAPSLWVKAQGARRFPRPWRAPAYAEEAYAKGARVSYEGRRWVSEWDANVWQPDIFGWREEKES